jgi:LCP family protein required for cell wall assembly
LSHSDEPKPLWKRILRGVAYSVLLLFLLFTATFAGWVGRSETVQGLLGGMMGEKPTQVFRSKEVTLLILGCDQDLVYGGGKVLAAAARSDMMLLVRVNFDKNLISALSIPRDIRLRASEYGVTLPASLGDYLRINGFHAHGGPSVSEKVVEQLLDIKVDRTVSIDFVAFKNLIDSLGGVEVFVERPMKYRDVRGHLDIDLKKGRQVLNGEQAMGFVRFRKGQGENDFTRQQRQKEILFAIKDKVISQPTRIPDVSVQAVRVLGNAMTGRELGSLIWFGSKVQGSSVKMGSLPVRERMRGLYYQELKRKEAEKMLQEFGFKDSGSLVENEGDRA